MYNHHNHRGALWSIDMEHICLTHKLDFSESTWCKSVYVTADDKYISFAIHKIDTQNFGVQPTTNLQIVQYMLFWIIVTATATATATAIATVY